MKTDKSNSLSPITHAITLLQPWAWAVACGYRPIDQRQQLLSFWSQPAAADPLDEIGNAGSRPRRVAIYAGQSYREMSSPNEFFIRDLHPGLNHYLDSDDTPPDPGYGSKSPKSQWSPDAVFHFGCIIGTVDILAQIDTEGEAGFDFDDAVQPPDSPSPAAIQPAAWFDPVAGRYLLLLANARLFDMPIPITDKSARMGDFPLTAEFAGKVAAAELLPPRKPFDIGSFAIASDVDSGSGEAAGNLTSSAATA